MAGGRGELLTVLVFDGVVVRSVVMEITFTNTGHMFGTALDKPTLLREQWYLDQDFLFLNSSQYNSHTMFGSVLLISKVQSTVTTTERIIFVFLK